MSKDKVFGDDNNKVFLIDQNTCEVMVDESVSVTYIINELKNFNLNVINIISKRNRLEELFMDLTKEEVSV